MFRTMQPLGEMLCWQCAKVSCPTLSGGSLLRSNTLPTLDAAAISVAAGDATFQGGAR
jgi:hypothetical protein